MERYDSYKDSGVEWIGEIPSHWSILRNKYFTTQRKDKSETGEEDLLSVSEHQGVVPRRVIRDGEEHLSRSDSFEGYLKVSPGELVSNIMLMWKTGLGVSEYEGLVSPAYSVFRFTHGSPKYFHYLFRTSQYTSEYRRNSTGVIESRLRLYDDSFGRLPSHSPPLHEQEQIVEYLDRKTALIDSLIEKTVRKIELLKEKRTSLINEVVTKGLNPDVEMKDSGVEWIGEIPRHWECVRLGMLGRFSSSGIDKKSKDGEEQVKMVNYTDLVSRGTYNPVLTKGQTFMQVTTPKSKLEEHGLNRGDLVMIPSSETHEDLGYSSLIDFQSANIVFSYHILRFQFNRNVAHYFKKYLINHHAVLNQFSSEGKGTTRQIIGRYVVNGARVVLPPLHEQEQIVEYLDEQTSIIDSTITSEEKRIELLKEYRQSLISEVVTGKVKITRDE